MISKKNQSEPFNLRTLVAVGLISASILSFEILLMQFFSIVQWDHFAAMVISIALLGFGASGTLLAIFRKWMISRSQFLIPFFMISCGVLMTLSLRLSQSDHFFFDSFTLFQAQGQMPRLAMTYLFFFLPFFSGALAIGLVFMTGLANINRYYFSDLFGAGIGAVVVILLLWKLNPSEIFLILSSVAIFSGLICSNFRKNSWLLLYGLSSLFVLIYFNNQSLKVRTSKYKSISYALNLPQANVDYSRSSPFGLTQVVSSPALRYAPGLSFSFDQKVSSNPMVYQNGNWIGSIPVSHQLDTPSILEYTTMALPYWLCSGQKALLLNVNAGLNLQQALQNGFNEIDAVEDNTMILNLLQHDYAGQTDSLFFHPRIEWHRISRRSFVNQSQSSYDLIELPLLGSFGGGVGLNAMTEDNLLTMESFNKLWEKLKPEGILAISCWLDQPPKMTLKLVNMLDELLDGARVNEPAADIAAVRSWGTMTFVLKKSGFSKRDQERIEQFCEKFEFDRVKMGSSEILSHGFFNDLQDSTVLSSIAAMFGNRKDSIVQNHAFNIQVATDDKPYFNQFLRLENLKFEDSHLAMSKGHYLELGYLLSLGTLFQVVILAFLFILLPLFKLRKKTKGRIWSLIYFSAIGMGYMFVEIVLIKYFAPYLGHPIYSIAGVISLMLIFSGLGSLYVTRIANKTRKLELIFGLVTGLLVLYAVVLSGALSATAIWPLYLKAMIMAVLIGVPAFFMGMPFPMGLKMIASKDNSQVPWAWGINGCLSVISSALAPLLALQFGFAIVLLFGALTYSLAWMSGLRIN